jgi:hypothetical protein
MMNIIGISTITADTSGNVIIEPNANTKMKNNTRRAIRTKTLDGGVVFTDSGYTDGDRTFQIHSNVTKETWDKIWNIFKSYTLVQVASEDGFFSAAIESARYEENEAILSILIKERLDA